MSPALDTSAPPGLPAEAKTDPIPVVEPPTSPMPMLGRPPIGAAPDDTLDRHARQAGTLAAFVGLVLLVALLLAFGAL